MVTCKILNRDEFLEFIGPKISKSFSMKYHFVLLMISLDQIHPDPSKLKRLPQKKLKTNDLQNMYDMVLVEFADGLKKELLEVEDFADDSKPKPYDVFLVEGTPNTSKKNRVSICLPLMNEDEYQYEEEEEEKEKDNSSEKDEGGGGGEKENVTEEENNNNQYEKKTEQRERKEKTGGETTVPNPEKCDKHEDEKENDEDKPSTAWFDGGKKLIPMKDILPIRRIASLSGPARVLENVCKAENSALSRASMERTCIIDGVDDHDRVLEEIDIDDELRESISSLNGSQQRVLATIVDPRFENGFCPVQGPPGTGKTSLLVATIAALGKDHKVLVTAPSNAAVANIALKLYSTGRYDFEEMCVYGEGADPSVHFLNLRFRGEKFRKICEQLEDVSYRQEEKLRKQMVSWLNLKANSDPSWDELASMCPFYHPRENHDDLAEALGHMKVIFSTLNSAGSALLQQAFRPKTVMLDEAGQSPEVEFFILTNFTQIQRMIVVGDPKQLPATVISKKCQYKRYGVSWLENIYSLQPKKVQFLDTQYRMEPDILKFPNQTFYKNRIVSGPNVIGRKPSINYPFLFVDTNGYGTEEREGFSWKNVVEAQVILSILENDEDIETLLSERRQKKREPIRVIIITPYRGQTKQLLMKTLNYLVRNKLERKQNMKIDVSTIDSFQGQEADVVIVSTVRTEREGFVDNKKRLNVALTRAKRVLRVVGDSSLFQNLSRRSSTLRKLLEDAIKSKLIQRIKKRATTMTNSSRSLFTLLPPSEKLGSSPKRSYHLATCSLSSGTKQLLFKSLYDTTLIENIRPGTRYAMKTIISRSYYTLVPTSEKLPSTKQPFLKSYYSSTSSWKSHRTSNNITWFFRELLHVMRRR